MKYPQPEPGEDRDDPFFYIKSAEKAFVAFSSQLPGKDAKGFISESENGKIFSFESYLRELGKPADEIEALCKAAKRIDFKTNSKLVKRGAWAYNIKLLLKMIPGFILFTTFIYTVLAFVLGLFHVRLFTWKIYFSFVLIVSGIITLYVGYKILRAQNLKAGTPMFVIKYFDNDELTFTKANRRLFKTPESGK